MADDLYVLGLGIDSSSLSLAGRNVESTLTRVQTKAQETKAQLQGAFGGPMVSNAQTATRAFGGLEPALEGVGAASTRTERAISRVSFGLATMARSGEVGGRGLRGVEMGLMTIAPAAGAALLGVTAVIEGTSLVTRQLDKEDAAWQKTLDSFRIDAPARTAAQTMSALGAQIKALQEQMDRGPSTTFGDWFHSVFSIEGTTPWLEAAKRLQREKADLERERALDQAHIAMNKANERGSSATSATEREAAYVREHTEALQGEIVKLRDGTEAFARYEDVIVHHVTPAHERLLAAHRAERDGLQATAAAAEKAARERAEAARRWQERELEDQHRANEKRINALQRLLDDEQHLTEERQKKLVDTATRGLDALMHGNLRGALSAGEEWLAPTLAEALGGRRDTVGTVATRREAQLTDLPRVLAERLGLRSMGVMGGGQEVEGLTIPATIGRAPRARRAPAGPPSAARVADYESSYFGGAGVVTAPAPPVVIHSETHFHLNSIDAKSGSEFIRDNAAHIANTVVGKIVTNPALRDLVAGGIQ